MSNNMFSTKNLRRPKVFAHKHVWRDFAVLPCLSVLHRIGESSALVVWRANVGRFLIRHKLLVYVVE